jgi:hypothetical protein
LETTAERSTAGVEERWAWSAEPDAAVAVATASVFTRLSRMMPG